MRFSIPFFMTVMLAGCATTQSPASIAARTPTPGSVTRDNPAGDAESPIDAALVRLLEMPTGHKHDKFGTLDVPFPDHKYWKRMRFFGYPMRAAFRYGKARYALSVIDYSEAPDDDSPIGCLERYVERGTAVADLFGVEVGDFRRSLSQHYRGVEAVDWEERLARDAAEAAKEDADRKEAIAELKKRAAARKRLTVKRRAAAKKHIAARKRAAAGSRLAYARRQAAQARARAAAMAVEDEDDDGGPLSWFAPVTKETEAARRRKRARVAARKRRAAQRLALARRARRKPRKPEPRYYGKHDMPVLQVSGEVVTLVHNERYLGALVAFRSWPGTCLVQGFAVQVGSDDELAEMVRQRWLDEMAPKLIWRRRLREIPEIQNR